MKKILLLLCIYVYSFSLGVNQGFLEPNEAFKPSFTKKEDSLNFKLDLGKDIYLYNDKLKILIKKPQEIEITKDINIPKAIAYEEYSVHFDNLNLIIPFDLLKSKIDAKDFEIEVKFQAPYSVASPGRPTRGVESASEESRMVSPPLRTSHWKV